METLFFYAAKVILCSGILFLYYHLFLKDRTFHHYNRFYLVASLIIAVLLPLLQVDYFTIEPNKDLYFLYLKLQNLQTLTTKHHDFIYLQLIAFLAGLVSVGFLGKLLIGILKIQKLRKHYRKEVFEGICFYNTNLSDAPFSFFRSLFWKDSILIQSDLGRQILKHEMVHIEQRHSIDKLLAEGLTAIFWFNPFFYLIKKELHLIHEYLADHKAVKHADTKAFAQMLLASHFSGKVLPATSPFLNSNLKKRLSMLKKSKTKYGYIRKIAALPLTFAVAFSYLVHAKNTEIRTTDRELKTMIKTMNIPVSDTLRNSIPADSLMKTQQENIAIANEKIKKESAKVEQLKTEGLKKFEELNAIQKSKGVHSEEYLSKMDDIRKLGKQIEKLIPGASSRIGNITDLDWKNIASDGYFDTSSIDSIRKQMSKFQRNFRIKALPDMKFDSAFVNGNAIKVFNNADGSRIIILNNGKDKMNTHYFKNPNPAFPKGTFPHTDGFGFRNGKKLSKKEQRKLDHLNKKQQKIDQERREILKDHQRFGLSDIQFREAPNPPKNSLTYSYSFKTDTPKNSGEFLSENDKGIKAFINGKEVSREEVNKLKPSDIKSINVIKNNKTDGELHITLK